MGIENFFKSFQKHKAKHPEALLPVSYMIKVRAHDDLQAVDSLRVLADEIELPHPTEEMHVDTEQNNSNQTTVYFSIYGFELFAQNLKKRILDQAPLDEDRSRSFKNITVDLDIMENKFDIQTEKGKDEKNDRYHYQFLDTITKAQYENVSLESDFVNATFYLNRLLFFSYSLDELNELNIEDEYRKLTFFAQDIQSNYQQQHQVSDDNFATIPEMHDFETQNVGAVYVPALTDLHRDSDTPSEDDDNSHDRDHDDSRDSDDGSDDAVRSLIDDGDTGSTDDKDNNDDNHDDSPDSSQGDKEASGSSLNDAPDNAGTSDDTDVKDSSPSPDPTDDDSKGEGHRTAKTVGELRKEQASQAGSDDSDDTTENEADRADSRPAETPEDIIKRIYAPHLYEMDIHFPQFTIDQDMKEPPDLDEAVKHNEFENQLYIVQETNRIKKQANEYLQHEAQQVSRNFNFDMGRVVLTVYKKLNDKIQQIKRSGQDNQKLDQSVQDYYDQQSQDAFDDLKSNKDTALEQRLDALKKEYEQKRADMIAQSDQDYENDRTNAKSRIQANAERMRNDNIARRDRALQQQIAQAKQQAENYLSHLLQSKADKYKDMADNLGQHLFSALQNNINANYPKLIDHVSILMNDQSQFNYSRKRLNESNASVYQKRLADYQDQLKRSRQDQESQSNDYEDRIRVLRERLDKRDDTSRKYDQLLSHKNDLEDKLGKIQQQIQDEQKKNADLKKQLDDAPLGKPDMTAKARSTEINYQSLQKDYKNLKEINDEYQDKIDDLQQDLDNKKHFWEK